MKKIKKIEKVPSKIKIIEEETHKDESELEEELEETGEKQFRSFVSRGRRAKPVIVPVLQSGQAPQNVPSSRQASPARARTESTDEQFYRMKRETAEGARKYQAGIMQQDVGASQRQALEKSRNIRGMSQRQANVATQGIADEEKENKYKSSQENKKRRYAWEV